MDNCSVLTKEKLNRFRELYSIEIIEVNPAYTSHECSCCGYIDEKNRKDTHHFKCKACGRKLNAQVNGARNISKRSSLTGIRLHTPKKQVLRVLVRQYLERLNGCNSAPVKLLKTNPYFMDYLSNFKPLECGGNKCL
jgi:putative transposase